MARTDLTGAAEVFDVSEVFPGCERAEAQVVSTDTDQLRVWLHYTKHDPTTFLVCIDRIYGDLLEKARQTRQAAR